MTTQSEQILEENLISQLVTLGYSKVTIKDEKDLLSNLKSQLEKHNNVTFSDTEFVQVINHLSKGNVFEKAKTLRDKFNVKKDNGESFYIEFIQLEHWCQNQFGVRQRFVRNPNLDAGNPYN